LPERQKQQGRTESARPVLLVFLFRRVGHQRKANWRASRVSLSLARIVRSASFLTHTSTVPQVGALPAMTDRFLAGAWQRRI